ncbi:MAG: methionine biosynthesis protein MetW [Actinobacteria bacterium]|nr:methionine biosynthesis protein MetW [Actinomycetota bacterium]
MVVDRVDKAVNGAGKQRLDYDLIIDLVTEESRVLDLGCSTGDLLKLLIKQKKVTGFGVEIEEEKVYSCIAKGLSVHHGDIDDGLADYPDHSFDYVILSLTLQAVKKPKFVIEEMLRVGGKAIVSFPNFAYLPIRWQLAALGRMPMTTDIPYEWYETPNIHLTTIKDFSRFCGENSIKVSDVFYLGSKGQIRFAPNVFAKSALFVLG